MYERLHGPLSQTLNISMNFESQRSAGGVSVFFLIGHLLSFVDNPERMEALHHPLPNPAPLKGREGWGVSGINAFVLVRAESILFQAGTECLWIDLQEFRQLCPVDKGVIFHDLQDGLALRLFRGDIPEGLDIQ